MSDALPAAVPEREESLSTVDGGAELADDDDPTELEAPVSVEAEEEKNPQSTVGADGELSDDDPATLVDPVVDADDAPVSVKGVEEEDEEEEEEEEERAVCGRHRRGGET